MKEKRYYKDTKFGEMLAKRILQLRIEHNYSQEYVIDQTHLDIHRYETGTSIPVLMSILQICKFYNITLDEFFAPMNYPSKE